jgi:hypothetical protein
VVFADQTGRVAFADLEALEVWDTPDHEYNGGLANADRDDQLWIDHDGLVIVHDLIEWQMPGGEGEGDADFEVGIGTRVLANAESIASWDAGWSGTHLQAPARGAPITLSGQSAIAAIVAIMAAGERHDHSGAFIRRRTDASGRTVMLDDDADALVRLAPDGASLEQLADQVDAASLQVAPNGEWIALEIRIDECLLDAQSECEWLLTKLALWHEGEALRPAAFVGLRLEPLAVTNDGHVLALGVDVSAGPTPDPLPAQQLLWLDADLEILAAVSIENLGFVRELFTLDDGRLVIELHANGEGTLLIADPESGTLAPVPESLDVDHHQVWVGATQETLAFVHFDSEGSRRLIAGALP